MNDFDLIKTELSLHGITCAADGTFSVDGENRTAKDILGGLALHIKNNKQLFFELWNDLIKCLKRAEAGNGNEYTQKMFANSFKVLLRYTKHFPVLKQYQSLVFSYMNCDSNKFSEKFMSDVIDFQIGLDWMNHLVRLDNFKINLIQRLLKNQMAKSVIAADIAGVQGPWSNFDLPMGERVWDWSVDQEDFDTSTKNRQRSGRYNLPETYNDPLSFEEGFVWRDLRNDPFDPDDESDNPYPTSGQPFTRP